MRPSRHSMRTLIAAIVLLLATLLSVECASAQVFPGYALVRSRRGPKRPRLPWRSARGRRGRLQTAARRASLGERFRPRHLFPGHVCGCDSRTEQLRALKERSVTVRESAPKARSVGLPLLHQTFRC